MFFSVVKQCHNDSHAKVRNAICLAIATLLIRWNNIQNIVNIVVENIGTSDPDYLLLNILGLLPVEVKSSRV